MLSGERKPDRKTGIDVLGDIPWGTHLCLFYENKQDLIDVLVPYFKAGLESNEFCMWVTSGPLNEEQAREALSAAVPGFDRYIQTGQLEIVPHNQWYLKDGVFELQKVIGRWNDKIAQAVFAGFDGVRVSGNAAWLEAKDWMCFADYEKQVNSAIDEYDVLAICSYSLNKCNAAEIVDVISNHKSALIRREGKWELIKNSERKKDKGTLQVSENKYKTLLENIPQKIFLKDTNSVYISCNESYTRDLKIKAEEIAGKTDYHFFPKDLAEKYRADDKRVMESGQTEDIDEKYIQQGKEIFVHTVKAPVRDTEGNVVGILGIFWDNTAQRRAQERLLAYQKRLRDLASEMSLIEERERKHLATELHDQVTQNLILFKINLIELLDKSLSGEMVKPLDEIYKSLDRIIGDMRSLIFDLGSPTLYELGLEAAVREYLCEEIQQKHGIKAEFEDDAQPKPLDGDVCAVLYRAVRELLINVVKHAQARHVKVSICKDNKNIRIKVIDDGVGFKPPAEVFGSGKKAGFGLFSLRERLNYLGGRVEIESKPAEGTSVTLVAPTKCAKFVRK
jgi:PAS domain S-box-containing protein